MRQALAIKELALKAGFDLVGIASVVPGRDLEFAQQWVERCLGGEMRYLANPKRFDPHSVLHSVKSVVCVGLVYHTSHPYSTEINGTGVRSQEPGVSRQSPAGSREKPEVACKVMEGGILGSNPEP